ALQMPPHHEHSIEATLDEPPAKVRRIAARKALEARFPRDIAEKDVLIVCQEVDIPIKTDTETSIRLIGRRGAMGKEHREIDPPRQLAEERSVVLNRMRDDDREAHRLPKYY